MVHTDGRPTIANAVPSLRVTSVTLSNGVQQYVIKTQAGEVVSEPFASSILAIEELRARMKGK